MTTRRLSRGFALLLLLTALIPDYGSYVLQLVTIIAASLATGLFLQSAPHSSARNRDAFIGAKDGRFKQAVIAYFAAWGVSAGPKA